ncbi:hypothetical protein NVP1101O_045 [Vibrio phage 1.101.O._10N.261.45.C6]|nr:hypothetical protein NVP1101O_045 [Vibrio phage 1.101.O._10N.261.45.C6]
MKKGIKAKVTIETTYSFDITPENGFDGVNFDDLESVLDISKSVKANPQNYCSAFGEEDSEIRYDQETKVSNVKVEFIEE